MALPQRKQFSRIVCDPRVVGGEPTIKGTRIPVRSIILFQRYEGSLNHIYEAFPRLSREGVEEALAYYAAHREEIDRYVHENQDDSD